MQASQRMNRLLLTLIALVTLTATALAAEPGASFPANPGPNDVRPGSILVYNYYTSDANNPAASDTTINITNASFIDDAYVHLFFVDGLTCSIADVSLCLTQNQTASFRASDFDPGTTGYLIAVGFGPGGDGGFGCPSSRLLGSARLRSGAGLAVINALAIDGTNTGECGFSEADFLLRIPVRVPLVLAIDSVQSVADARTFIVVNRIGGNLATGPGPIGNLFGVVYDDAENTFSFTLNATGCQLRGNLAAGTPRTAPPITTLIPSGRTGWLKFWSPMNRGITGAVLEFASDGSVGGRNMHALTLTNEAILIPFFGNQCGF